MKPLEKEQKAIHEAADRLSVPRANEEARRDKKQADERAAKAVESMENYIRKRPPIIWSRLNSRWNAWPTTAAAVQRKEQLLREVAQLRQKQDELPSRRGTGRAGRP